MLRALGLADSKVLADDLACDGCVLDSIPHGCAASTAQPLQTVCVLLLIRDQPRIGLINASSPKAVVALSFVNALDRCEGICTECLTRVVREPALAALSVRVLTAAVIKLQMQAAGLDFERAMCSQCGLAAAAQDSTVGTPCLAQALLKVSRATLQAGQSLQTMHTQGRRQQANRAV